VRGTDKLVHKNGGNETMGAAEGAVEALAADARRGKYL